MSKSNYLRELLASAKAQYPFVSQYDPLVTQGPDTGDYAETWPVGETGDPSYPRPADIPIDRTGVQVMRPDRFHAADLAGEMLHIDPLARGTQNILQRLLSSGQVRELQRNSGDYAQSLRMGLSPDRAMQNATDSAIRGYAIGQWPAEANAAMNYTPEQRNLLQQLQQYMTQGYYPSDYHLPAGR